MTDENKDLTVGEITATEIPVEQAQSQSEEWSPETDEEILASRDGWKPPHLFDGDKTKALSAREFNLRKPLLEAVSSSNRRVREQERVIQDMLANQQKLMEKLKNKELEELHNRKLDAVAQADLDAYSQIEKRMSEVAAEPVIQKQGLPPLTTQEQQKIEEFANKHASWFNEETKLGQRMIKYALTAFPEIRMESPTRSVDENLKLLEAELSEFMPKTTIQQAVLPSTQASHSNRTASVKLNESQKYAADAYVRMGGKLEDYVKQLKELGDL